MRAVFGGGVSTLRRKSSFVSSPKRLSTAALGSQPLSSESKTKKAFVVLSKSAEKSAKNGSLSKCSVPFTSVVFVGMLVYVALVAWYVSHPYAILPLRMDVTPLRSSHDWSDANDFLDLIRPNSREYVIRWLFEPDSLCFDGSQHSARFQAADSMFANDGYVDGSEADDDAMDDSIAGSGAALRKRTAIATVLIRYCDYRKSACAHIRFNRLLYALIHGVHYCELRKPMVVSYAADSGQNQPEKELSQNRTHSSQQIETKQKLFAQENKQPESGSQSSAERRRLSGGLRKRRRQRRRKQKLLNGQISVKWNKLEFIRYLLDAKRNGNDSALNFDTLAWIDADAVIVNFNRQIDSFARDYFVPRQFVGFSQDTTNNSQFEEGCDLTLEWFPKHGINTGVFVLKNSQWSRSLLDYCLSKGVVFDAEMQQVAADGFRDQWALARYRVDFPLLWDDHSCVIRDLKAMQTLKKPRQRHELRGKHKAEKEEDAWVWHVAGGAKDKSNSLKKALKIECVLMNSHPPFLANYSGLSDIQFASIQRSCRELFEQI